MKILGRRVWRIAIVIVGPFVVLFAIILVVVALPCETMKVVLKNRSESPALVRVGVHFPTREIWRGRVEAGETREMSLAAIPMGRFVDTFVQFPDIDDREMSKFEELLFAGYPFGVDTYRFEFAPGRIRSETIAGRWSDRFKSKWGGAVAFLAEMVFVSLRCLDCEVAEWLAPARP